MKKKYYRRMMIIVFAMIIPTLSLTGCRKEEDQSAKAYYVISEELDFSKTANKAQEILEKK